MGAFNRKHARARAHRRRATPPMFNRYKAGLTRTEPARCTSIRACAQVSSRS